MDTGQQQQRPRGRPPLPSEQVRRHSLGLRATKQLKDLLQSAADSSGRSLAHEMEFRLEQSFARERTLAEHTADAFGGARAAALFQVLAGQAQLWGGDERWLDDWYGFDAVRSLWARTLDDLAPPRPDPVAETIAQGRLFAARLRANPDQWGRALYCAILDDLACDAGLPSDVRAEFAEAATAGGATAEEKARARAAVEEIADMPLFPAQRRPRRRQRRTTK